MTDEIQAVTPESSGIPQFYYSIDEFNILLEPSVKTEIVEQRSIYPIPHAPEWCRGMISLRGKLIPVVNIHRLLGRSLEQQSHWLLIIETGELPPAAICIDKLPSQHKVQADSYQVINDDSMPFWIKRFVEIDDKPVYEADHNTLFQALVLQNMQSLTLNTPEPNHSDVPGIEV